MGVLDERERFLSIAEIAVQEEIREWWWGSTEGEVRLRYIWRSRAC
jgi:hypothetical protein